MTSLDAILEQTCGELPRQPLLKWAAILFSLFVLTLQLSIAVSQAMLAGAAVLYAVYLLRTRPVVVRFLPVKFPLALFCLFSLLPIFWAENSGVGWFAIRKLVLFLVWLLAMNLVLSARHLVRLLQGMFAISLFTSLVGILQFVRQYRDVRAHHPGEMYLYLTTRRIHGLMGHWMNFGGQQMMVFAFLLAFLLLSRARPVESETRLSFFWWTVLTIVAVSILLNFTRGVWLGCLVAAIYMVARWRPKWLWALPVLLALGYVGAPSLVRERVYMALHPHQELALENRLEMWGVALRMIRAHPWVGVGPNNVEEDYPAYMPPGQTPELGYHNHFHNDFLQFAAERGLPCLAAWVWLMAVIGWYAWKLRSRIPQAWIADACFAAWLAFLAEGCFEFNFGTSPVLMAFLFFTATPFIAAAASDTVSVGFTNG